MINKDYWQKIVKRLSDYRIEGMNVKDYNPDNDEDGTIGIRLADLILDEQRTINFEKESHDRPYEKMYELSKNLNVNHLSGDASVKRKILEDLFEKFSPGGKQDLRGRDDLYVGVVFKKIYFFAERISRGKH